MDQPATFEAWINQLIRERFGTMSALCEAIGVSQSSFGRQIKERGTVGVEPLLALAALTNRKPGEVLRMGNRE